jgi:hypothetical protein
MQCPHGPIGHSVIPGPNAVDQGPWEGLVHEKLGLLAFLDERVTKVSGFDGVPVDSIQVVQRLIEYCISSSGIPIREGTAHPLRLGPAHDFIEFSHQIIGRWPPV